MPLSDNELRLVNQLAPIIERQLPKGLFLCVAKNTMTIGWGGLGFYWGRPIFTVPVRPQRFTFPLLTKAQEFIVGIPDEGKLIDERFKAGTWSGRDGDKFERLGFKTVSGKMVDAPAIVQCRWQIECVVKAQTTLSLDGTKPDIVSQMYPSHDFHTLFMGEIVACYETET